MKETNRKSRRAALKGFAATLAGVFGFATVNAAVSKNESTRKSAGSITKEQDVPLFSGHTIHNNTVYVAGKGAHFDGDITDHTNHVLDEVEKELKKAGTSMEKVLKVNVYLNDLNDYKAMNAAYRGRFGDSPPVRTTVAVYGGVPGDSLVEIDCIAVLK